MDQTARPGRRGCVGDATSLPNCSRPTSHASGAPSKGIAVNAAETPPLDWHRYRQLKAEGRLNLLLRLSEPMAMKVSDVWLENPFPSNVLPFISRAEHLRWRRVWQRGRFVRLSWSPEERAALMRQDAIFREEDSAWAERHGPRAGGETEVMKHPNLLRFEKDPQKRRLNQHWREKYGTMILRAREAEQGHTRCENGTQEPAGAED